MQFSEKSLFQSIQKFSLGTFISRISGLIRDISLAYCFGASIEIATFMVAYRIANLFRRLIGESSLHASFIPHYEHIKTQNPQKSAEFYRDTLFSVLIAVMGFLLFSEVIGSFFFSHKSINTFSLTLVMLPGLLFITLYGISSALLQCEKHFFLPAIAPMAFNIILALGAFWIKQQNGSMHLLAFFVVGGFFLQWLPLGWKSVRLLRSYLSFSQWLRPQLFSSDLKKIIKPLSLSFIGIGAAQINSAVDALFAQYAEMAGPVYLWYSNRIAQLPLGLFGIAIAAATFPSLCRALLKQDEAQYENILIGSIKKAVGIIIPATFAIIALGGVSINLLFGRGAFSPAAVIKTFHCLIFYGLGLFSLSLILIFANAFYARKNYLLPTIATLIAVALNFLLNFLFIFYLHKEAISVAYATAISSFIHLVFLSGQLKKMHVIGKMLSSVLKVGSICAISTLATLVLGNYLIHDPTWKILQGKMGEYSQIMTQQIWSFSIMTVLFVVFVITLAKIFHVTEITNWLKFAYKKQEKALN